MSSIEFLPPPGVELYHEGLKSCSQLSNTHGLTRVRVECHSVGRGAGAGGSGWVCSGDSAGGRIGIL